MAHLGEFEQLVLFSVLQLGKDASGVTIRELIEEKTGRAASSGAIYTVLGRLESRGLVTSLEASPTTGRAGRPRKRYCLEPEGARALQESYSALQALARGTLARLNDLAQEG